jgi:hypothetical protein
MHLKRFLNNMIKPPIGIKPRFLLDENRLNEIMLAISKRLCEFEIPIEWIIEHNEIVKRNQNKNVNKYK